MPRCCRPSPQWPVANIPNSNLQYDNPHFSHSEYLHENTEVRETTRDSWNGCVSELTEKKKKNERRAKEIMSQTNTLPSTMPLLQLQTHDRDADAFHSISLCVSLTQQPYSTTQSVSHKHIHTNTTHTHIYTHNNKYSQMKDGFSQFLTDFF